MIYFCSGEPNTVPKSFILKVIVSQCLFIDDNNTSQPNEFDVGEARSAKWLQCLYCIVVHRHLQHLFEWHEANGIDLVEFVRG